MIGRSYSEASLSKLIYAAITSLDGFIEDADGRFDWAVPDDEVHEFMNDLEATIGTHLYGRRMYETMAVWETIGDTPGVSAVELDYAAKWRAADKVVYSETLDEIWTSRTRLEHNFDPERVRHMKESATENISISGPGLAQHAFRAGLIDEIHLFVCPILVGAGKAGIPRNGTVDLELLDERRFGNGVVHLHYRTR